MAEQIYTVDWAPPGVSEREKRRAGMHCAERGADVAERLLLLDMLGLPPCERPMRSTDKDKKYTGRSKKDSG